MKKRINSTSSLKGDKWTPVSLNADIKRQMRTETHNHQHCPIPKIPKKQPNTHKKQTQPSEKEMIACQAKQQKEESSSPHELISNFINAADRIANLLKEEDRACSYQIYLQDRNKVVEYLDRIIMPESKQPIKHPQQERPKFTQDYLNKQLNAIRLNIDKVIRRKKRSKSSFPLTQTLPQGENAVKGKDDELSTVRYLLAQESAKNSALKLQIAELTKQIERLQGNFVYLELLTFKSEQMFIQSLIDDNESAQFSLIDKQKAASLLSSLRETIIYIRSQDSNSSLSITHKLKEEAQSMVLYISEMRKKALALLKEKEKSLKRLEQEEQNFEQLKVKVSRLNGEMGELVEEVDKKDELIEYIKLENSNLKQDLKSMEDMVKQTKQQYHNVADELYLTTEKLRVTQSLLQGKDEQISQLLSEIESKNRELISKLEEIQAKEEDIGALKQEHAKLEEASAKAISTLSEEKKLLALEKQRKQHELKQTESKVKFLEEEGSILEKKIESVFNEEEDYKFKISLLEDKIDSLQRENEQLYSDIRSLEKEQGKEEADMQRSNKQLQGECSALKREAAQNAKRIKFYEEQMVQLAKMTDTSYFERQIQDKEKTIAQLQLNLRKYQKSQQITPIIEENSEEIEAQNSPIQSVDDLNAVKAQHEEHPDERIHSRKDQILQDLIDCLPQFDKRDVSNSSYQSAHYSDQQAADQLSVSKREQSGVSGLSFYEINVINETLNRIDSHTAATPKKVVQQQSPMLLVVNHKRERSNYADFELSSAEGDDNNPNKSKDQYHINYDSDSDSHDRLSSLSRNVNIDRVMESSEDRMNELEDEVGHQLTPTKPNQVHDLLMSSSSNAANKERHLGRSPMKNVDIEQEIKAQLRFSGQNEKDVQNSRLSGDRGEKTKGNIMLNNNFGKVLRAKSCFGKDD